jgi:hypothetical protein
VSAAEVFVAVKLPVASTTVRYIGPEATGDIMAGVERIRLGYDTGHVDLVGRRRDLVDAVRGLAEQLGICVDASAEPG